MKATGQVRTFVSSWAQAGTGRSRVRSIVGVGLGGILVSATAAGVALLVAAICGSWPASISATILTVLAAPALIAVLRQWRARTRSRGRRTLPYRYSLSISGVAMVVTLTWIWPHADPVTPPSTPDARVLALTDGTKLVVHVSRSQSATKPPLVVVHGGPGVADPQHDAAALGRLATDRDVYIYDQLGTGGSDRLNNPRGYTDNRALDDLDRVVALTDGAKVALLGHSWGSRLVIKYAAAHPDRVAALILSAPTFPPSPESVRQQLGDPTERLNLLQRLHLYGHLLRPRNLFTYLLGRVDLEVAHHAAGDTEMDARFATIYRHTTPGLFCDPALAERLGVTGVGYYAHHALVTDTSSLYDPSTPVPQRQPITAPTLIIKPACDYLPWAAISAHRAITPAARLVVLPDAGHQAYLEQPGAYIDLVSAFLADRPLPLPVVDASTPPPSYRGKR